MDKHFTLAEQILFNIETIIRRSVFLVLSFNFNSQLHALRRLMQGTPEHPKAPLGNNFRPPQPLLHRPVRTNIDFRTKQNGKLCPTMYRDLHYKGTYDACSSTVSREKIFVTKLTEIQTFGFHSFSSVPAHSQYLERALNNLDPMTKLENELKQEASDLAHGD